jgi:cold shock CspA family protein
MSTTDRYTGQVKWFNNKTGYGFITICDGEHKDKDIFTHYSSIGVSDSQYKYLVQGEYVELGLVKPETGDHEYQATDVLVLREVALCARLASKACRVARSAHVHANNKDLVPRTLGQRLIE